ncbi:hypothetical protein ACL6C3_22430 [Capilliphycus salinus ALCB114379]
MIFSLVIQVTFPPSKFLDLTGAFQFIDTHLLKLNGLARAIASGKPLECG